MHPIVLVLLAFAVLAACFFGAYFLYKKIYEYAWRTQISWAKAVLESDDDNWKSQQKRPTEPKGRMGRLLPPVIIDDAHGECNDAKTRIERKQRQAATLEELEYARQSDNVIDRFARYRRLPFWNLDAEHLDAAREERRDAAIVCANYLLEKARSGHHLSFVSLVQLITPETDGLKSAYQSMIGEKYVYPDDWDDLVTTTYERTSIDQYNRDLKNLRGLLRREAQLALRERSLKSAKYLVACYDEDEDARMEIGFTLVVRLANLVTELHKEKGMIFIY